MFKVKIESAKVIGLFFYRLLFFSVLIFKTSDGITRSNLVDIPTLKLIITQPILDLFNLKNSQSVTLNQKAEDSPIVIYKPKVEKIQEIEEAIYNLAQLVNAGDEQTILFVKQNQFKIGYWLSYFAIDHATLNNIVFRQFLNLPVEETDSFIKIFYVYTKVLGIEFMKNSLLAIVDTSYSKSEKIFFNELIVSKNTQVNKLMSYLIRYFYLGPKSKNFLRADFDYKLFQLSHEVLINMDFIESILELHKRSDIDIEKVFSASIEDYAVNYLSYTAGNSEAGFYEKSYRGVYYRPWIEKVSEVLGTDKMAEVLKLAMTKQSKYLAQESFNTQIGNNNLDVFIKSKPSHLEDGILRWVFFKGHDDLRQVMAEWILETINQGKDWFGFYTPSGETERSKITNFHEMIKKVIGEYIDNVLANSNTQLKFDVSFFLEHKLISKDKANEIAAVLSRNEVINSYEKSMMNQMNLLIKEYFKEKRDKSNKSLNVVEISIQEYLNSNTSEFMEGQKGFEAIQYGEININNQVRLLNAEELKSVTFYMIAGAFNSNKLLRLIKHIVKFGDPLKAIIVDDYGTLYQFAVEFLLSRIKYNLAVEGKGKSFENFEVMLNLYLLNDNNLYGEEISKNFPILLSFLGSKAKLKEYYSKKVTQLLNSMPFYEGITNINSEAFVFEKQKNKFDFLKGIKKNDGNFLISDFKLQMEVGEINDSKFPLITDLLFNFINSEGVKQELTLDDISDVSYSYVESQFEISFKNKLTLTLNKSSLNIKLSNQSSTKSEKSLIFLDNAIKVSKTNQSLVSNLNLPKLVRIIDDNLVYSEILVNPDFKILFENHSLGFSKFDIFINYIKNKFLSE